MKPFEKYIQESSVDIPKSNLDPTVFQFPDGGGQPYLQPSIKKQIVDALNNFEGYIQVEDVYIVGSILTKLYNENSDIDVNLITTDANVDDLTTTQLLTIIRQINGKLAIGTTHPINFYIVLNAFDPINYDAIYDLRSDKWIKEPQNIELNISQYLNNFNKVVSKIDLTIAQLRREIIDYDTLATFTPEQIKDIQSQLQRKLVEISDKIDTLIDIRKVIHRKRKKAFNRPMSPEEIKNYRSKNFLPENIIDKLLQRYYYWDFIKKLENIVNDKEIIDAKDLAAIKRVDKAACLKNFESYVETDGKNIVKESLRKVKLRKINWKDPTSRTKSFMQKYERGSHRKNMQQVPDSQRVDKRSIMSSNLGSAKKIVEVAKNAPSGIWRITPSQVSWLAQKYHHIPPNQHKNIKHLGNTGIIVWRKAANVYYLVKPSKHFLTK